jgi:hypothetical protein
MAVSLNKTKATQKEIKNGMPMILQWKSADECLLKLNL